MIFGSVCSGIEAASVAWHPLGWRAAWFSEIEKFPNAILAHHWPSVKNLGDMKKFKEWGLEPGAIDLFVGGTPCQSFSVAGLRKGMADPRGNLALVFLAIADRVRPRWVVWENVPGVLSSGQGRDFGSFLGALAELGYGFAYRVLDAQHFGVPQRRRRVFVVGYLGDWRRAAAVLFERESLSGNSPPSRAARERIAPTISARTKGGGGLGTDFDCDGGLIQNAAGSDVIGALGTDSSGVNGSRDNLTQYLISHSLLAKANDSFDDTLQTYITHALRADGFDASEDGTGRGTPLVAMPPPMSFMWQSALGCSFDEDRVATLIKNQTPAVAIRTAQTSSNGWGIGVGEQAYTLDSTQPCAVAFMPARTFGTDGGIDSRFAQRDICDALHTASGSGNKAPLVQQPYKMQVRRLTPRECERLQGFPDDYTLIPVKRVRRERMTLPRADGRYREIDGEVWQLAADGPRYKALGNSMAVPVMRWIGKRIEQVEKEI